MATSPGRISNNLLRLCCFSVIIALAILPCKIHAHPYHNTLQSSGFYLGLSAMTVQANYESDDVAHGFQVRAGTSLSKYLSIESRLGATTTNEKTDLYYNDDYYYDSVTNSYYRVERDESLSIHQQLSGYLKVKYPTYIIPYLLVGGVVDHYTLCVELEGCDTGISSDLALGGGILLPLRGELLNGIYVEKTDHRLDPDGFNDVDLQQLHVGIQGRF